MAHATDPARTRTPAPPILAVLDETIAARRAAGHSVEALSSARDRIATLLAADAHYDTTLEHLRELNRTIAEQGWMEVEHDALRTAGGEFVRACAARGRALDQAQGGAQ